MMQVYGKALDDLYEGKLPKGWKFGAAANKVYVDMLKNPDKGEQPYTYGERLHHIPEWSGFTDDDVAYCGYMNQIESVRDELKFMIQEGIQSNRICLVIWIPSDASLDNPPCFQWGQVRTSESNKVSLRILFRSNDAGNAVFANMGAITRVFVDEVIEPAGGELEELIWVAVSEHLYNTDMSMVEALIGKIPEHIRRYL